MARLPTSPCSHVLLQLHRAPTPLNYLFIKLYMFEQWEPLTGLLSGVINKEDESNEGEEPLHSEDAALGTPQPCGPWRRVGSSPGLFWMPGGHKSLFLLGPINEKDFLGIILISVYSGGGIHMPGASSMRIQPLRNGKCCRSSRN